VVISAGKDLEKNVITLIKNGQVWTSGALRKIEILIGEGGKIIGLFDRHQSISLKAEETIDAAGGLVFPGGIDMHAHTQDGAETFFPGTSAAAIGGITSVVDMPPFHACTTQQGCLERMRLAQNECVTDFGLGGGIVVTQEDLKYIDDVARFGSPYFKVFMPSDPPVDAALLWASVKAAAHTGLRMAIHVEEVGCLDSDVDWGDPLGFARARPAVAETSAAAQVLEMARAAGAPVHICHISAGRTAELIDIYRKWGVDVTGETAPHYLILDESEFRRRGARVKTTPPLRSPQDNQILWQALADGVIDAVISDHFLGELPQLGKPSLGLRELEAGIASLELSLPLLYEAGVNQGRISLNRFVEVTATRPAEILGFAYCKGKIALGLDADLVILDPQATWTASATWPDSRISMTPYEGKKFQGQVVRTLVRGKTVWDGQTICAGRGFGQFVASRIP
jgi:dihydroorotase (multifunctional complex type)